MGSRWKGIVGSVAPSHSGRSGRRCWSRSSSSCSCSGRRRGDQIGSRSRFARCRTIGLYGRCVGGVGGFCEQREVAALELAFWLSAALVLDEKALKVEAVAALTVFRLVRGQTANLCQPTLETRLTPARLLRRRRLLLLDDGRRGGRRISRHRRPRMLVSQGGLGVHLASGCEGRLWRGAR